MSSRTLTWIGIGLLALTAIVLPLVQNVSRNGIARRRFREWFETRAPYVLLVAAVLFAVDFLPLLYRGLVRLKKFSGFDGTSWVVLATVAPFDDASPQLALSTARSWAGDDTVRRDDSYGAAVDRIFDDEGDLQRFVPLDELLDELASAR